jgi:hypothetical protein
LRIESELGSTSVQAFVALWNWGACWFIVGGRVKSPCRSASGNPGTPWERIQSANLRSCSWSRPLLAAGDKRLGKRWSQAPSAALNAGELGLAGPGEIVICTCVPDPETWGSG